MIIELKSWLIDWLDDWTPGFSPSASHQSPCLWLSSSYTCHLIFGPRLTTLAPSITPSLFHSRLKTHFSTILLTTDCLSFPRNWLHGLFRSTGSFEHIGFLALVIKITFHALDTSQLLSARKYHLLYLSLNRCVSRVCCKSTRHWLTALP